MMFFNRVRFYRTRGYCKVMPVYILYNLSFFADMMRYRVLRHFAQKYLRMGIKNKNVCPNQFLGIL